MVLPVLHSQQAVTPSHSQSGQCPGRLEARSEAALLCLWSLNKTIYLISLKKGKENWRAEGTQKSGPPKTVGSKPWNLKNVTLFGKGIFKDVIKWRILSWGDNPIWSGWTLSAFTPILFFFFLKISFFFKILFFCVCFGSLLLHSDFLWLWQVGITLLWGAQASH